MANWSILVLYGLWVTSPELAIYGLMPYPALICLFGQLSISSTPRPIPLVLGLGFLSPFQGPEAPGPYPFDQGLKGHLRPLQCLQPAGRGPYGPWDPLGLNPMRSKGGKGAYQWAHLSTFLAKWPKTPEKHILASNPRGPKMTIGEFSSQDFNHGLLQSPEAQVTFMKGFPLKIRETPNFNSN
ncbi:hypothetical protein O181_055343 [Austropuccinia psidii MF-1]|uniref:Uncharacterized protein n=1 Tax=Austropuccinia psidii MF-1 TaxID=1389203 RepID=A0A9Q3E7Q1_9BASI|nr:hypothetical protein [Austropuccinia psidii MF-1]